MIERLIDRLNSSPVNFLAVRRLETELQAAGFVCLDAAEPLKLPSDGKFYVKKNDSSLYAFRLGTASLADAGFHVICSHCDSPTFRIKPNAEMTADGGIVKLNTEVYGGPILSTWFDRPLSVAGRVVLRGTDAMHPECRLLHVKRPLLQISSLAIHFNRQVNDGVKLSKQKDTLPLLGILNDELERGNLLQQIICTELSVSPEQILDFDLYLYDATPACTFGAHGEFLSSGRQDDLTMAFASLEAILTCRENSRTQVMAVFDNEETGSQTKQGAGSPFFSSLLRRIILAQGGDEAAFWQCVERSFMVSADNAHAFHPNYGEKYDPTNHPQLGGGPVIKFNASQKYVSDAVSAAVFAEICRESGVPCQRFVNHSDVAGGSTLGNILSASLPLRGVDMGAPILAMHSARETGAVRDYEYCVRAFAHFYES